MWNPDNPMANNMPREMGYMGDIRYRPPPLPRSAPLLPIPPPPPCPPLLAQFMEPPPPPPPTEATAPIMVRGPIYSESYMQTTPVLVGPFNQPPPSLPPNFNASRPPPPLEAQKRAAEFCEAGPSKARKTDDVTCIYSCDNCRQRNSRLELFRVEIRKLQHEKEQITLLYDREQKDFENDRKLLKSIVRPELYKLLDDYVEGLSLVGPDDTIPPSSSPPTGTRSSTPDITSPEELRAVLERMRTT